MSFNTPMAALVAVAIMFTCGAFLAPQRAHANDISSTLPPSLLHSPLNQTKEALHPNKPKLLMFFQPDCHWCKKEAPILNELKQSCGSHVDILLVGFNGKKNTLKRELRHYEKGLSAFYAPPKIVRLLGGVSTSPTFLFFNNKQTLLAKQSGYLPRKKLGNAVNLLTNTKCATKNKP